MLTYEEMLLARIALRKRGYHHAYYFGTEKEGYTLRCSRYAPLSEGWWREPYIEIREPGDLRRHLEAKGA